MLSSKEDPKIKKAEPGVICEGSHLERDLLAAMIKTLDPLMADGELTTLVKYHSVLLSIHPDINKASDLSPENLDWLMGDRPADEYGPDSYDGISLSDKQAHDAKGDAAYLCWDFVWSIMDNHSPDGHFFGVVEADTSCYGYFLSEPDFDHIEEPEDPTSIRQVMGYLARIQDYLRGMPYTAELTVHYDKSWTIYCIDGGDTPTDIASGQIKWVG